MVRKINKFLKIKNQTNESADIYFYGDIVSDDWGKWSDTDVAPEDVVKALDEIKDAKNLNIYINSGGGSVFAGLAIYNMLKRHKAYKTVYVDGLAASIASVIALAGDKIVIPSNAFLMIHKPWSISMGNSNDFRKMADDLDRIEEGIMNVYADNLAENVDIETVRQLVNDETWLNGNEAVKYFNVEIAEENKMAACINGESLNNYKNIPESLKIVEDKLLDQDEKANDLEIEKMKMELELLAY